MQGSANHGIDSEISIRTIYQDVASTELNLFMKDKDINRKSSPFVWCSANREKYPHLARRYLLSPSCITIIREKEFKVAKRVTTGRLRLKPENVQKHSSLNIYLENV